MYATTIIASHRQYVLHRRAVSAIPSCDENCRAFLARGHKTEEDPETHASIANESLVAFVTSTFNTDYRAARLRARRVRRALGTKSGSRDGRRRSGRFARDPSRVRRAREQARAPGAARKK